MNILFSTQANKLELFFDLSKKIEGIAQFRISGAQLIFENSLENRTNIFFKYHCAKYFFRKAKEFLNKKI